MVLHHRSKSEESAYAGSSAWIEDVGAAFRLDYANKNYIFSPIKDRDGVLVSKVYQYINNQIVELDTKTPDVAIIADVKEYLASKQAKYSELKKYLCEELGHPFVRTQNVLEKYDGIEWQSKRVPEKNARIFQLMTTPAYIDMPIIKV